VILERRDPGSSVYIVIECITDKSNIDFPRERLVAHRSAADARSTSRVGVLLAMTLSCSCICSGISFETAVSTAMELEKQDALHNGTTN
jgi:hypothetical protein